MKRGIFKFAPLVLLGVLRAIKADVCEDDFKGKLPTSSDEDPWTWRKVVATWSKLPLPPKLTVKIEEMYVKSWEQNEVFKNTSWGVYRQIIMIDGQDVKTVGGVPCKPRKRKRRHDLDAKAGKRNVRQAADAKAGKRKNRQATDAKAGKRKNRQATDAKAGKRTNRQASDAKGGQRKGRQASDSPPKKKKKTRYCKKKKRKPRINDDAAVAALPAEDTPFCDALPNNGAESFTVDRFVSMVDTQKSYFNVDINETHREGNETTTESRTYTLEPKKGADGKLMSIAITLKASPTEKDKKDLKGLQIVSQSIARFKDQFGSDKDKYYYDSLATIAWGMEGANYRVKEVRIYMISQAGDICGDFSAYGAYRRIMLNKTHVESGESSVAVVETKSSWYTSIFSYSFRVSSWFSAYQETIINHKFGSATNMKVVEKVRLSDQGQIKFIKIIWDVQKDTKSFTMVAILFSKDGGLPTVTIKDFGESNKGVASYKVEVLIQFRTKSFQLQQSKSMVEVQQLQAQSEDMGELELNFNYTYVKTVKEFNYTAAIVSTTQRRKREADQAFWERWLSSDL